MTSEDEQPPIGMSQEKWQAYLEHQESREAMLKERFDTELKISPPIPPWLKYPEHAADSMFWRMGQGETYLHDYMVVYFKYASQAEKAAYKFKYPAPKEWTLFYNENQ